MKNELPEGLSTLSARRRPSSRSNKDVDAILPPRILTLMKVGSTVVVNRGRTGERAVRATVRLGRDLFVNFNGDWEWHRTGERGYPPGLEKFLGYVRDPRMVAVLDRAFGVPAGEDELARYFPDLHAERPDTRERDALVAKFFAPGEASKRFDRREYERDVDAITTGYSVARPEKRRLS